MLTRYIQAAMCKIKWEILPDNYFYGSIPELPGIYASNTGLDACMKELQEVLEEWIVLGIARHTPLPVIDGVEIKVKDAV
jgi:predicted RNase H-like HicB family nuclease